MPCYRKDDHAMRPTYKLIHLTSFVHAYGHYRLLCADLFLNEFKLRKFYFCKSDVSAVQGHPRSLTLVPIWSVHATFY